MFTGRSESPPGLCFNVGTESHTHGTTSFLVGHPPSKASQGQKGPSEPRSERIRSGRTSLDREEGTLVPFGVLILTFGAITSLRVSKDRRRIDAASSLGLENKKSPGSSPGLVGLMFSCCLLHG